MPLPPAPRADKPRPEKPRADKPKRVRKPKPPARANMRLTGWIAAVIILLDQALKYWVVHVLQLDRVRAIDVFPPWLNLRMAWNQGMNFGLMASDTEVTRGVLIAVAVAISGWVWIWVWRSAAGRIVQIAAGTLIGGALGNVIDRLTYGAVADFLNMSLPGMHNPYSFNVADIAIFAGAIGLVLVPQAAPAKPGKRAKRKPRATPPDGQPSAIGDKTRDEAGK
ncbi:signal peptidase II [Paracoccus sp. (in: a-proteobacteria)]|uniref:signal peptidase II n=1 Tax=Paracoccus sp. TaxID=267 RepID=UPI003A849D66